MIVVAAFTRRGALMASRVARTIGGRAFVPAAYVCDGTEPMTVPLSQWAACWFGVCGAMVFVSACGIAVRAVAPLLVHKAQDPAVIVMDEVGHNVISLVSGHLGGANRLARRIAEFTGGRAVITTATDINDIEAPDEWAAKNGCVVENPQTIKHVSATMLDGTNVGVAVSEYLQMPPWPVTLWLRPRVLTLGVGCRRCTSPEALVVAADDFLNGSGVSRHSVERIASIDVKKDEEAIISLSREWGVPFDTYSANALAALRGRFSHSNRVYGTVGVGNVCERAAVLASGGVIMRCKTKYPGITLALARRKIL